ncbi:hypothetical protein C8R48DRAFT_768955 [Suillus tomentosus]|nr:hypothetical protein C8R48DRAFT_768955 [Suillus tomentosus]
MAWPTNSPEIQHRVFSLLGILTPSPSEHLSVKYRVISNSFNATPRHSALRLPIHTTLLKVAANNGELETLRLSKKDVEHTVKLDRAHLERKICLLSFASLGFAHVGHDLPYSEVASILHIEFSEVEKWAIDVNLLSGKLSQTTQYLRVY